MKHSLKSEISKYSFCYIMIFPFMALFLFFVILPIIVAFILSFTEFDMVSFPKFIGFDNYVRIFLDDQDFITALKNTLVFAIITGPVGYFACLIFAWLINELGPKLRAILTCVFYAPTISGTLYVMWGFIFSGDQYGFLNSTLMQLGFIDEPVMWLTDPAYMLTVVMVVQIWMSLGTAFLSFIAGLQNVPSSLYEAAAVDGVRNRWQELIYITLPSMGPQLLFGAVLQISGAFSVGSVVTALLGFPTTDNAALTIITHITDYGNARYEMGYASALSFVLFVIIVVTNNVIQRFIRNHSNV